MTALGRPGAATDVLPHAVHALQPVRRPMRPADLDAVMAVEAGAYSFPWSRGNFIDSLAADYRAELLFDARHGLLAYSVAQPGVGEMHLLNLTVAAPWRRRGLAQALLDALLDDCRARALLQLFLEVRAGNAAAIALYHRRGFAEVGLRRDYYPAAQGRREDARVMRLDVPPHAAPAGARAP